MTGAGSAGTAGDGYRGRKGTCRSHPELGEQHVTRMFHRDRPDEVEDVLLCIGCMKESKPYGRPELAS